MTDESQLSALEDQVEFRLSKKAKCACFLSHMPVCTAYSKFDGAVVDYCTNVFDNHYCAHLPACHASSPQESKV